MHSCTPSWSKMEFVHIRFNARARVKVEWSHWWSSIKRFGEDSSETTESESQQYANHLYKSSDFFAESVYFLM